MIKILIDTDLVDPLFIRYAFQRGEGILRLGPKENRFKDREIIRVLNHKSNRPRDNRGCYPVTYETGYIKKGIRTGDFYNDQKTV